MCANFAVQYLQKGRLIRPYNIANYMWHCVPSSYVSKQKTTCL